jgi:RNA polymerase sigma-70 factor, ECF subfamily
MVADPDAALLVAFQRGDESAFRTLFERYARSMVAFCHHFVGDRARAEELAQDVFLKLHQAAPRYQPSARFKTFLFRIASNHCLNELRRGEHSARAADRPMPGEEPQDPDALPGGAPTPEEHAAGGALARAVEAMLARLPEKQRVAFVLCRFQGLSYEEIAEALDATVPAVKSLIHRATVTAAEALAPFAPEGEVVP